MDDRDLSQKIGGFIGTAYATFVWVFFIALAIIVIAALASALLTP